MADNLWRIILRQSYYDRYITVDISRQIHYGMYGKLLMAYIYIKIHRGRYIMADTLWQIFCVTQKQPYLNKFTAPEVLDCCV